MLNKQFSYLNVSLERSSTLLYGSVDYGYQRQNNQADCYYDRYLLLFRHCVKLPNDRVGMAVTAGAVRVTMAATRVTVTMTSVLKLVNRTSS